MLVPCEKGEWALLEPYAWDMLGNLEAVSFPLYHDGIKTETGFLRRVEEVFTRPDEELLLYYHSGRAAGWAHTYWIPEESALGLVSMAVQGDFGQALEELLAYWKKRFPGYQWFSYFPADNREAHSFLQRSGYKPQPPENVAVLLFDNYSARGEAPQVVEIGLDNFPLFCQLHRRFEGSMYWTSERMKSQLDTWSIFAYTEKGKCLGALYYNHQTQKDLEIFGLDLLEKEREIAGALLSSALNQAKAGGARSMYFFHEPVWTPMLESLGFKNLATALGYSGAV